MSKIELTLKSQESKLNGITLYEPINIELIDKLLKSDLLKDNFSNDTLNNMYTGEYELLSKYKKLIVKKKAVVKYNKVKGLAFGRVIPDKALGLFNIRRELRHTLATENFKDIDIENCHPVILHQICKAHNIDCDYLEEYVYNRQMFLDEVMNTYKVDRDAAKKLFIKLMYFGGFESWAVCYNVTEGPTKNIQRFKKNVQEIGNKICEANQEIIKAVKKRKEEQKKKDYNLVGTVVSYFLQEYECRILEEIYLYCVENKYIKKGVCVLCADGLMILKENYDESLLKEFRKLIKDKFGFKLTFTEKEMNQGYNKILDDHIITDEEYKQRIEDNLDEYTKMKIELEKRFFMIEEPMTYCWINDNGELTSKNIKDIKQLLKPYKIEDKEFFDLWLEDKTRRSYLKFDFIPNTEDSKIYNLFQGFKYDNDEPIIEKKIKPFLDLINTLLNNETESINALLDWLAWIRQKPQIKSEKAVVLYSEAQGVGKNTLIQLFSKVIGYTAEVNNINDLIKNFNSHITHKLIISADEIKVKAREIRDDLKNMITRTKMMKERKGHDAVQINDYSNYIFSTNNQNSFYIEPTDRRYILLQLQNIVMTEEISNKLYKLLDDDKCLKSFDTFLKTRQLPDRIIAPMNEYKRLLIAQSQPAYITMIYKNPKLFESQKFRLSEIYEMSIEYAKKHFMESTFSSDKMNKDFKNEFGRFFKKGREYNFYSFPKERELTDILNTIRPELLL